MSPPLHCCPVVTTPMFATGTSAQVPGECAGWAPVQAVLGQPRAGHRDSCQVQVPYPQPTLVSVAWETEDDRHFSEHQQVSRKLLLASSPRSREACVHLSWILGQ